LKVASADPGWLPPFSTNVADLDLPVHVRFAPKATELSHRTETTLSAKRR